jgi:large subunit ribosomal protein L24
MVMKKIQQGDTVQVIAGNNKGTIATVMKVHEDKVLLKDVNMRKKAVKGQWFVEKPAPLHISNVMLYDAKAKKPSRVKITVEKNKKTRMYKTSQQPVLAA